MDTMSIVTAHPEGAARLPGSRHLPRGSSLQERAR